jgi:hypothetical protein
MLEITERTRHIYWQHSEHKTYDETKHEDVAMCFIYFSYHWLNKKGDVLTDYHIGVIYFDVVVALLRKIKIRRNVITVCFRIL